MSAFKRLAIVILLAVAVTSMAACGFIGARHKSAVKPTGFLLYGHAAVTLPSNDQRAAGTTCVATGGATDVARDTRVTVLDPSGHKLAVGALDAGVIARANDIATCDFSFSIPAVPGGVDTYSIQIGTRDPQRFAAATLRQNTPAVITITP